ncbi:hypothetical protein Tsubulata_011959 [Turnera subulata]|uniref:RING-type E3 ubiquitin transferase n=1 Tax=Turnera subulata TaxID=218843 RepID=A0A9Q0GIH8_9ROSI|nr:hypothetical protein Tsubulata_011959 [Turnera subulata]
MRKIGMEKHEQIGILFWVWVGHVAGAATMAKAQPTSSQASQYGLYSRFDPAMEIVMVVLICAFFLVGIFSVFIRHCTESSSAGSARRRRLTSGLGWGSGGGGGGGGLAPSVIDTFPTFVYSAVKGIKMGGLECAVCLSEFGDEETLRLLPRCDHVFHPQCIDAWLSSHVTCPVCRANLSPKTTCSSPTPQPHQSTPPPTQQPTTEATQICININDGSLETTGVLQEQEQGSSSSRAVGLIKLQRSHSTGHSLTNSNHMEEEERYTLRLPEEYSRMKRTLSSNVVFPREDSSSKGYKNDVSAAWGFVSNYYKANRGTAASFINNVVSSTSNCKVDTEVADDHSSHGRRFLASVKRPLNCLSVNVISDGADKSCPPL